MPRVQSKTNSEEELEGVNASLTPNQGQSARKRHICPTCDRSFTTSGHLARHSRVHTGEKNHKCPFPGCETRCSRQDNLQQHYRIHLSPGSRRSSSRSASTRRGKRGSGASSSPDHAESEHAPFSPPPLVQATIPTSVSPPPLENVRASGTGTRAPAYSPPPDSPPPLAHATLLPTFQQRPSPVSSATSSPEIPYTAVSSSSFAPSMSPPLASPPSAATINGYSFRSGTTAYQEQARFPSSSESYASSDGYANAHYSLPRIETLTSPKNDSPPPSSVSILNSALSRHSISHISHSHSQSAYSRPVSSMTSRPGTGPPSPASSHSTSRSSLSHSGPPTPSGYYDDNGQSSPYDHGVNSILEPSLSRYSPPPVLAPIQGFSAHEPVEVLSRSVSGVRVVNEHYERKHAPTRGDYSDRYMHYETRYVPEEPRYGRMYGLVHDRPELAVQNYLPHPSSPMDYHDMYSAGGGVSLNHGAWKSEHMANRGMKSINALVQ
jgi:zinc-finger protein CreA/MIG